MKWPWSFLSLRILVPGTGFDDMSFDVSRWFASCMPCLINYSWIYVSAAHPIVSASPTTIYSETKILAVLLLHFCWIMNILWSCSSCTNILHLSNLINIDNMCTCVHVCTSQTLQTLILWTRGCDIIEEISLKQKWARPYPHHHKSVIVASDWSR